MLTSENRATFGRILTVLAIVGTVLFVLRLVSRPKPRKQIKNAPKKQNRRVVTVSARNGRSMQEFARDTITEQFMEFVRRTLEILARSIFNMPTAD